MESTQMRVRPHHCVMLVVAALCGTQDIECAGRKLLRAISDATLVQLAFCLHLALVHPVEWLGITHILTFLVQTHTSQP